MQSPDGILVLSKEEEVVYANKAMLNLVKLNTNDEIVCKLNEIQIHDQRILDHLRENPRVHANNIEWACN